MGLRQRIQNWTRLQTIIAVLAKHGFSGILFELGWSTAGKKTQWEPSDVQTIPSRLRQAFEELGPTFIKLGQLLSTRSDLLPEAYIQEFSKLTDQIPSFPYEKVLQILEAEFDRGPYEIFSSIEAEPLAAASIAQVHRAILRETGEHVVIKVQRPEIDRTVQSDIQVLFFVARTLERLRDDLKLLNPTAIVKEFQRTIFEELDFTLEATHLDQFHELFPSYEGINIPKVNWDYTTKRVLTMTELPGKSLAHIEEFPPNVDRSFLAEALAGFFFESMFFHGVFHADAHAGNILLNTEGKGSLGILDFGMVGTLRSDTKAQLSKIFLAVVARDFEGLVLAYSEIGEFGKRFSIRDFQRDVTHLLSPHIGRPLREIHIGRLLVESTTIARKYHVKLPRDLILFYRSLMNLEHIGRKLDPDFEFLTYGQKFAQSLMRRRFSVEELSKDLYKTLEGLRSLGTELPSQVRTIVKKMEDENFPWGDNTLDRTLENFRQMNRQTNLAFITLGLLFCATLLTALKGDSDAILPLWLSGGFLGMILLLMILRGGNRL